MKISICFNTKIYRNIFSRSVSSSNTLFCNVLIRSQRPQITRNVNYELAEIKVNDVTLNLNNYIKKIEEEHNKLNGNKNYENTSRIPEVETVMSLLNQRKEIIENLVAVKELENEPDMNLQQLAKVDIENYKIALEEVDQELISALMPIADEDECNAIVLEVNAGVGGQEAMLFARELFDMYFNFAGYKGYQVELADLAKTDIGGLRHGTLLISGDSVFRMFKYEAGVHRVQRIPSTEKSGRMHTSTVSVLALPQPTDIQINIHSKDLKIETKRASGAGGQHVNTTDSAVRITHIPSGVSVECQVDRSQIKNKRIAMTKLRTLLYKRELDSKVAEIDATRKNQVRSNFRNEKIRTYNFSQDRITDHRIRGSIHNLKGFLEGSASLEHLITNLDKNDRLAKLLEIINKVNHC
ncbi:hypothetical protein HHI36_004807 [Cryptolaemus montrouzieri]|uniref:Prokaryotic-type class I peptide chain release factors domain-containing protein n=1 Tax=Cryptolaemus montrouzieri TaxID=559131 RepID=A0ABD2NTU9_9CUCU